MKSFRPIFRTVIAAITLFLAITIGGPATALDCVDYFDYAHVSSRQSIFGQGDQVVTQGNTAYVGTDQQLKIFDITDPTEPVELVSFGERGSKCISLYGSLAYISYVGDAADHIDIAGFQIVDISDPSAPVVLSTTETYPDRLGVSARIGNHLLISHADGLRVYDVSDSAAPLFIDQFPAIGSFFDIEIDGIHAYLSGGHEVRVIDISNPTAPALVTALATSQSTQGMDLTGDQLLVAQRWLTNGQLLILDVSNPGAPVQLSLQDLPGTLTDVCRIGDHAFISSGGLIVMDIGDPSAPEYMGVVTFSDGARWVAAAGDQVCISTNNSAYMASYSQFVTVDVSNPNFIPMFASEIAAAAAAMVSLGEHAFLAAGDDDLVVLDLQDPAAPVVLSETYLYGRAHDIVIAGDLAYLAAREGGLQIVDISDPATPVHVGGLVTADDAMSIAIDDAAQVAYVVLNSNALFSVDISDPSQPVQLGVITNYHGNRHIALAGDLLIRGGYESVIYIDVSDPSAMTQSGGFDCGGFPGVRIPIVVEDLLIIGSTSSWDDMCGSAIMVYDISDPQDQVRLDTLPLPQCSLDDLAVSGNTIYAATGLGYAIDFSDPHELVLLGQYGDTWASAVAASEDRVILSYDASSGLNPLSLAPPPCPRTTAVPEEPVAQTHPWLACQPNPFNPTTHVYFEMPTAGRADLAIYSIDGRLVRTLIGAALPAGMHRAQWDGRSDAGLAQSSGIYLLQFQGPGVRAQEKLVLIR